MAHRRANLGAAMAAAADASSSRGHNRRTAPGREPIVTGMATVSTADTWPPIRCSGHSGGPLWRSISVRLRHSARPAGLPARETARPSRTRACERSRPAEPPRRSMVPLGSASSTAAAPGASSVARRAMPPATLASGAVPASRLSTAISVTPASLMVGSGTRPGPAIVGNRMAIVGSRIGPSRASPRWRTRSRSITAPRRPETSEATDPAKAGSTGRPRPVSVREPTTASLTTRSWWTGPGGFVPGCSSARPARAETGSPPSTTTVSAASVSGRNCTRISTTPVRKPARSSSSTRPSLASSARHDVPTSSSSDLRVAADRRSCSRAWRPAASRRLMPPVIAGSRSTPAAGPPPAPRSPQASRSPPVSRHRRPLTIRAR